MDGLQALIQKAVVLRQRGDREHALELYSAAFNILIDTAGAYARKQVGDTIDLEELRLQTPLLFAHAKVYLKQNLHAARILNEMGLLFGELGDYENAASKLAEAISFIPDGVDYDEPIKNLEALAAAHESVVGEHDEQAF